jgi:F-type H+-transporting ATPase subunit alpha
MFRTKEAKQEYEKSLQEVSEIGYVETITPPLVYVNGLPGARIHEVVYFETGESGVILSLEKETAEILVFSQETIRAGSKVSRSGKLLEVPVGKDFLGSSVDALGKSLDNTIKSPEADEYRNIDAVAQGIAGRVKVTEPMITGVTVVDNLVPLGKGQRELVLGDRKVGKTEFLQQVILTQAKMGTICIYAGVGKKKLDIIKVQEFVQKNNIKDQTVIISSSTTDPVGMIYITPYTAMTLSEYFRDIGHDVLFIFDDLFTHARFYRELSLVGRRFPGRNSYPGDIFYLHSRLLERGGNYKTPNGPRSITCLPVVETIEGDISGYIQTNLMSITDGHIFFSQDIFEAGRRPSVDYFLSVTRVGRQTQSKLRWGANRELSSFLTLLEKTEKFVHFGAEVNEGIRSTISMGEKIKSFLNQPMGIVYPINVQVFVFSLIWTGVLGKISPSDVERLRDKTANLYISNAQVKTMIDQLIDASPEFNTLLGKIGANASQLVKIFKP